MHFILGLDIGTTGCKASIYNEKGSVCASAYREYLNLHADGSLDAEGVWSRMREAIGVCTKGYPEIEAVCTASFGETVVCTDTRGNALSRAILYTNANAQEDWKKLDQAAGGSRIAEITGHISHPMYTISRLMWIKRNQKEVYDKTEKFLFMAGFIEKKLGGDWCAEETLAARSMAYDVRKGKWSDELCTAAGISLEKLPPVVKAGEAVGTVKEELVKYFGWKKPPVILAGGHDQPCTALGLGAVNGGDAAYGLGTAECFTLVLDAFTQSEKMQKAHLICTPHVVEHKYVTYGVLFSGNIVLSRLKEALYTGETQQEKSGGVNVYEQMMREMPETTDLLFLPHLAGTGTPQMDMDDRGVIHGLTLETKRGELVRAALEGIAFDMRRNMDNMKACGLPIGQILAAGGGARASKGLQIRSDILGEPIYVSEDVQAGTRGVFYIAAKALGWIQEYEQIKNYSECIQYRPRQSLYPLIMNRRKDVTGSYIKNAVIINKKIRERNVMKSLAVTTDHQLKIVEIPMPKIGDDCVLTKTLASGICSGTDRKILRGEFKGITQYPCLLGHEAVGEVIQVGKNVRRFKLGDRVMVPFLETDESGRYAGYYSAWSGYSEYTVARDYEAMAQAGKGPEHPSFWDAYLTQQVLPKDIDPADGVMMITFSEVLAAIEQFGFSEKDKIAVYGAGPVGLSFIQLMRLKGIQHIISVDIQEEKREAALQAGARMFVNGRLESVSESIRKAYPKGVDYVLDAAGINNMINEAMYFLKENGRICVYGICPEKSMNLSWEHGPQNWTLCFLHVPVKEKQARAFLQIVKWVQEGKLKPSGFISHKIPFSKLPETFEFLEKGGAAKKIVVVYDK